jgi:hypothetical protein
MRKSILIIWIAVAVVLIAGLFYSQKHTAEESAEPVNNEIHVFYPLPNGVVTSPLEARGEARGNWFFEASFPVKLVDASGNVLAQIPAQAKGDWMTADFVPFTARLEFAQPRTDTGTIIFHNDNESGLPEKDKEFRIPIRFR